MATLNEKWLEESKMIAENLDGAPVMYFQLLAGQVFTLKYFPLGGMTIRGTKKLQEVIDLFGFTPSKEGWYNILGEYLGETIKIDMEG